MKRPLATTLAVFAVISLTATTWLVRPELGEQAAETTVVSTPALIEQGRYLARAGNCMACHTEPGGKPFAGGRRIGTPFGDVFTGNLTPDEETGLGRWSAADFWRALHYGKSRDGRRLYPAFPYPNYTRVSRADADAIFAYLQSLPPVVSPLRPATVRFPYDTQAAQLVWRALYFRPGAQPPAADRPTLWNRGAYLVEGLGHCNACHTARTWLGGTDTAVDYSGASIPLLGWDALPLGYATPPTDEEAAELAQLLQTGTSRRDVMTGPMAEVVFHSLQYLADTDIEAIVAYLRTLPRRDTRLRRLGPPVGEDQLEGLLKLGQSVYSQYCSECHGDDGAGKPYVYPALAGNRLVTALSANNALQTVLFGGFAPSTTGHPRPYGMPPYAQQLSATQIAAVLTYVRASWGNAAPAVAPAAVLER
jgi:mono/diheme cytochrome c family protein